MAYIKKNIINILYSPYEIMLFIAIWTYGLFGAFITRSDNNLLLIFSSIIALFLSYIFLFLDHYHKKKELKISISNIKITLLLFLSLLLLINDGIFSWFYNDQSAHVTEAFKHGIFLAQLLPGIKNISYNKISRQNLHSEEISNHVAVLAKNKAIREIVNKFQNKIIKKNKKICVEGRDIASKILAKNPKYDLAFYFKCNLKVASYRRWLDIKKKVSLKNVKKSLKKRTLMDKKRKNSPLIKVNDAILIRTDKLSKKQVVSKMSKHIERLN